MVILYVITAGIFAWFLFSKIRYIIQRSPEQQREDAAYSQLMSQLTEEASYYTGRQVSEEEILAKGRDFGRKHSRRRKKK